MYRIIVLGISFLLMFSFAGSAQTDTVYYNRDWNLTDFSSADICRTLKVADGDVFVEDRFFVKGIDTIYHHKRIELKYSRYSYAQYTQKGSVLEKGDYENNEKAGKWVSYYANTANVWYDCDYVNGKEVGELRTYYRSGKLKRSELRKADVTTVTGICYDEQGNEIAYVPIFILPKPAYDLNDYIGKNLHYPKRARAYEVEGRVIVKFVVNTDGHISDVNVVKTIGEGCDQAVGEMVLRMPPWIPGSIDGKPVAVSFTQPISFKLTD